MNGNLSITRRVVVGSLLAFPFAANAGGPEKTLPQMTVYRDPSCGCCHKWVEHLRANGFDVLVHDAPRGRGVKELGVPPELAACHTAQIGDYVIEGHVPADAIKRLLAEKPAGRGLAVPGMPAGSPGMEGGEPEIYDVILFGDGAAKPFGRFREGKPV